jgi:2-C-methyl-D-erythritol 4-phosphate cytidylyltransferase/2-C-methyl-D-erythritol 4-phosphate cytidylyltransferase/2-C-methyl-D-erythritol 2,4-cyclodiphosphate synthase
MGGKKKEYMPLPSPAEKPLTILGAVVSAFASCSQIGPIVIAIPPDEEDGEAMSCIPPELCSAKLPGRKDQNRITCVPGGRTRRSSVHNALSALKPYNLSHVLIHDGARPWIKQDLIERIIEAATKHGAVIPGLPLVETPKELDCKKPGVSDASFSGVMFIKRHLSRSEFCTAQTPQGFAFAEILAAHEKACEKEEKENFEYTDDAEVWGEFIGQVAVIPGDPVNRKITFQEDLELVFK